MKFLKAFYPLFLITGIVLILLVMAYFDL